MIDEYTEAALIPLMDEPRSYLLFAWLRCYHAHRTEFVFVSRPVNASMVPPWPSEQIDRALDVLLERRFIEIWQPPPPGSRPWRFRFVAIERWAEGLQ